MTTSLLRSRAALAALPLLCLTLAGSARAATINVVTPGEQNTQSGENGCMIGTTCGGGHWLHYPELLQVALGNGYAVQNNGDGGAVLGCDTTTATAAGGNSFCKSTQYTKSLTPTPNIAIIGPFGEHDQRIVSGMASLYTAAAFEAAYEGLVQDYLKLGAKVYMMTPIDLKWNANALPAGEDIVKDLMLPAAIKIAQAHQLTIIDTYTQITGTADLVTMYNGTDGQVNSAGQQKMAEMIEAALASTGGGTGGAGAGGGSGTAGASGVAGASGATGAGGAGGAAAGAGGTVGTTAGAGGAPTGAGGAVTAAGGAATAGGTAGNPGTTGAAGAAHAASSGDAPDSGCSIVAPGGGNWGARFFVALAGLAILARRRTRKDV